MTTMLKLNNQNLNDVHIGIDVRTDDDLLHQTTVEAYFRDDKSASEVILAFVYAYQAVAHHFNISDSLASKIVAQILLDKVEETLDIPFSDFAEPFDDTFDDTYELPYDLEM